MAAVATSAAGGGAAVAGAMTGATMRMHIATAEQQAAGRRTVAADMQAAGAGMAAVAGVSGEPHN